MTRVLIAGVLGALAMFVWTSVAHMVTPLGQIGMKTMSNEDPALAALQSATGDKAGMYMFPGVDPTDPNAMTAYEEKAKTVPWGLIIYHPPGADAGMSPTQLIAEFAKEFAQTLIAAFLLSLTVIATYLMRVVFVTLISVAAALSTNVSYLIWYKFPLDYTLGYMSIEIIAGLVAGLVIAYVLRPRAA